MVWMVQIYFKPSCTEFLSYYPRLEKFNLTCDTDNIYIQPGLKAKLLLTRIYNLNQIVNLYSTNQLTLEDIHVTFDGKAK